MTLIIERLRNLATNSDSFMSASSLPPVSDISDHTLTKPRIRVPKRAVVVLVCLLLTFISIGASYFWVMLSGERPVWLAPLLTVLWLAAGGGVFLMLYWMWQEFHRLSDDLSEWATALLNGDLSVRMPFHTEYCPSEGIRQHINVISSDYEGMAERQRLYLAQQVTYLAEKKYHLNVLYDVADCINSSSGLEDLLQRFLQTMQGVVNAKAAAVRLLDKDNNLQLVASIGLSHELDQQCWSLSDPLCACANSFKQNGVFRETNMSCCRLTQGTDFSEYSDCEMLAIPLRYRGQSLGVYNLFVPRNHEHEFSITDEDALLQSIGKHLGMAIEQAEVEENSRLLSIIQERTRMAHELHDSLAQTLASLRYKVRLFDDSLRKGDEQTLWQELEGLEAGIDDAYAELRSLITHFRAPIDGKGVLRTVERVVERFRRDTGYDVFFYHNWDLKELSRDAEIEVVRIVQEALANIRKHSGSETVRILMYSSKQGECSILIEDDGVGLPDDRPTPNNETGEHIGLSVMKERAERLNGELQLDSDGEGLLLQLNFKVPVSEAVSSKSSGK